ncbi:MAG: C1 family peptidase [Planctomycetota bacterium]|nr:C1 family peptidase [Planctomycetota bacterium]
MLHTKETRNRTYGWPLKAAGIVMAALVLASPAAGQLTPEDIDALRRQGEKEGWTFTVGENPATRRSLDELCGVVVPDNWRQGARFDPCNPRGMLPNTFDWRDVDGQNYCTPIRDQGGCGSCWAFALVGSFESNIVIMDGVYEDLSEQWLVSCTGLGGCNGEWPGNAANFYLCSGDYQDPCGGYGAVLEADFPYVAWDAPCECPYEHPYCLEDWAFIGPEWGIPTNEQLKQAIVDHGPITVCVYVNSAFSAYTGGIFNACQDYAINHAVDLVGWDDNQGDSGVWFLRNSWGPGWGEDGYMRIAYDCSRIGYNGLYVQYEGIQPTLVFTYPDGRPEMLDPDQDTAFRVHVSGENDGVPVPDSGQIHYSRNGGGFTTADMNDLGGGDYEATLPAAECFDVYDWYVSAEEETMGRIYDPPRAPDDTYSAVVATGEVVVFDDDFQSDHGWTVYAGADTGDWERADPQQVTSSGTITQPGDDHSPDGTLCFVTGPLAGGGAGDYDVDGGPTRLTSPAFDLQDLNATVSYWRWYHISTQWNDELLVEVSNDDGATWTTVESITDRQTWTYVQWNVSDYVDPTRQVRVRFTADDSPNDSLVEALIDDFAVTVLECEGGGIPEDINGDGTVNTADLLLLLAAWGPCPDCPEDINGDGTVNTEDLLLLLAAWGSG